MRLVIQRVERASVRVGTETVGEIGAGALVLVGIAHGDDAATANRAGDRLVNLRYFEDETGRTNRSIVDVGGAMLLVSQFTLLADTSHGRRPGFAAAAAPDMAAPIVERLADHVAAAGVPVARGRFGASMAVELVNDGPFTLVLDVD